MLSNIIYFSVIIFNIAFKIVFNTTNIALVFHLKFTCLIEKLILNINPFKESYYFFKFFV